MRSFATPYWEVVISRRCVGVATYYFEGWLNGTTDYFNALFQRGQRFCRFFNGTDDFLTGFESPRLLEPCCRSFMTYDVISTVLDWLFIFNFLLFVNRMRQETNWRSSQQHLCCWISVLIFAFSVLVLFIKPDEQEQEIMVPVGRAFWIGLW